MAKKKCGYYIIGDNKGIRVVHDCGWTVQTYDGPYRTKKAAQKVLNRRWKGGM